MPTPTKPNFATEPLIIALEDRKDWLEPSFIICRPSDLAKNGRKAGWLEQVKIGYKIPKGADPRFGDGFFAGPKTRLVVRYIAQPGTVEHMFYATLKQMDGVLLNTGSFGRPKLCSFPGALTRVLIGFQEILWNHAVTLEEVRRQQLLVQRKTAAATRKTGAKP